MLLQDVSDRKSQNLIDNGLCNTLTLNFIIREWWKMTKKTYTKKTFNNALLRPSKCLGKLIFSYTFGERRTDKFTFRGYLYINTKQYILLLSTHTYVMIINKRPAGIDSLKDLCNSLTSNLIETNLLTYWWKSIESPILNAKINYIHYYSTSNGFNLHSYLKSTCHANM